MTTAKNDFLAISEKRLYPHTDFRQLVPPDPAHIKTAKPYGSPIITSEVHSFIVEWQISTVDNYLHFQEKYDVDKPSFNKQEMP